MDLNILAQVNQQGYGIVGLNVLTAASRAGHTPAAWFLHPVDAPASDHELVQAAALRTKHYNPEAPSLRIYHARDLAQHVGRGLHAGWPIFEVTRLTDVDRHHLRAMDVVFVCTAWAAGVLADNSIPGERIARAPLAVDTRIFTPAPPLPVTQRPTTVFLNVGKWEVRKGHDLLVKAFNAAFNKDDDVSLIMACANPFLKADQALAWRDLYKNSPLGPRIQIHATRVRTQAELAQIMAGADCGVFPARAEGWNLDLAEMMAMGKPVIATDYSGHTEFCHAGNCRLIHVDRLETAHDGVWFFEQGEWGALGPDQFDQLVEHLRAVHRDKREGRLGVNQAGIDTFNHFTWQNTVKVLTSTLSGDTTTCRAAG